MRERRPNQDYYDEFAAGYEKRRHHGYHALIDRLEIAATLPYASGARVHYVDLVPRADGQPIPFPGWGPDIDIVVARLAIDLRGHGLVDVENVTADGRPIKTFRDVACDPADGSFYAICQERLAQLAFGRGRVIAHFISKQGGRRERVATMDILPTR